MVMVRLRVFGVARTSCLNSSTSAERVAASVMSAPFGADILVAFFSKLLK